MRKNQEQDKVGLDERARGNLRLQGLPGVCGCCFSLVRPGSEEVEKEAQGPRVVGLTYTAAGSFQLWNYCVVVGP